MSEIIIQDPVWQAIMADDRLSGARRKLSFHEIRLIIQHAQVSTPKLTDDAAVERACDQAEALALANAVMHGYREPPLVGWRDQPNADDLRSYMRSILTAALAAPEEKTNVE